MSLQAEIELAQVREELSAMRGAVEAVLSKCDAVEAEAPVGRFIAEEFRRVVHEEAGEYL